MLPLLGITALCGGSVVLLGCSSRVLKTCFVECKAWSLSTWAWHASFCLSSYLIGLMISEFSSVFLNDAETRHALWQCGLWCLSIHMVMLVPSLLFLHLAQRVGLHRKQQALVTMVLLGGWLLAFLHIDRWIGLAEPGTQAEDLGGGLQTFLSIEAYISRLNVLGVIIFALFSGFAAVNFPFTHLAPAHAVSASAIRSLEKRTQQTVKSAEIKRKQLEVLHAKQPEAPTAAGGGRGFWGFKKFLRKAPASSSDTSLRMELEVLDDLGRELMLELEEMKRIEERIELSKTLMGQMKRKMSMFLAVYCLYRVFWSAVITFTSHQLSQEDIVSRGFRVALNTLSVPVSTAWIPIVSFLFVGCLTVLQMRRFFFLVMRVSRLPLGLMDTDLLVLFSSFMMGAYFISVVTLMRTNLPKRFRRGVTSALGDLEYDFYRREFHGLFFFSACVTVVLLVVAQRIGKSRVQLSCRDEDGQFYEGLDEHEVDAMRSSAENNV